MEFNYSVNQKPGYMIPIVMEKSMRNQKEWKGTLGGVLGSHKYVDFSSGAFDDSKVLTHSLTHSLTHALLLTHSLTHSLTNYA